MEPGRTMTKSTDKNAKPADSVSAAFSHFAQTVAFLSGHPLAFLLAVVVVLAWIVTGPVFNYSDTWQLVINTGTTIVTFLMVFLIQNTQNRDMMALQLKLSELVLGSKNVANKFAAIEDLSDRELEKLHQECRRRADFTLARLEHRRASARRGSGTRAAARRTQAAHRK